MSKKKLIFHHRFGFLSRKWFWPFFTGAFLGLGYSSTKYALLSKIDIDKSNKESLNRLFSDQYSNSFVDSYHRPKEDQILRRNNTFNIENKNTLNDLINNNNNSIVPAFIVPKKIKINISDNSYLSFTIDFSETENNKILPAYKKNLAFFQEQDVDSLLQSLKNPKITKSSRVRAD